MSNTPISDLKQSWPCRAKHKDSNEPKKRIVVGLEVEQKVENERDENRNRFFVKSQEVYRIIKINHYFIDCIKFHSVFASRI